MPAPLAGARHPPCMKVCRRWASAEELSTHSLILDVPAGRVGPKECWDAGEPERVGLERVMLAPTLPGACDLCGEHRWGPVAVASVDVLPGLDRAAEDALRSLARRRGPRSGSQVRADVPFHAPSNRPDVSMRRWSGAGPLAMDRCGGAARARGLRAPAWHVPARQFRSPGRAGS